MDIFNKISGNIIIIGFLDETYLGNNITEIFYLQTNNNDMGVDFHNSIDVGKNIHLKDLHKHIKEIDNIYADYDIIKAYYPDFIKESLKITKKEIYIAFNNKSDYNFMFKKMKRFNLKIENSKIDDQIIMKIEVKKNNSFKIFGYYILDSITKIYNYISENI